MLNEKLRGKLQPRRLLPNLACILLIVFGAITLAWVGWLTWYDITVWGKAITSILFSSRTGEYMFPTLGIDMRVIHYFLIGLTLLLSGALASLRIRSKASKPNRNHPLNIQPLNDKREESMAKTLVKKEKARALDEKIFSGCLHEFGYLASRPKNTPIPNECIICQRLGDCMVATVIIKSANESSDFSGLPEIPQEVSDDLLLETSENLPTKRSRELLEKIREERIKEYLDHKKRKST